MLMVGAGLIGSLFPITDDHPPIREPLIREIVTLKVITDDFDYFPDTNGELIYRVNCQDGIVFVFFIPLPLELLDSNQE